MEDERVAKGNIKLLYERVATDNKREAQGVFFHIFHISCDRVTYEVGDTPDA